MFIPLLLTLSLGSTWHPISTPAINRTMLVNPGEKWITAYSSTPEETDDTPFITASGTTVREGIVAANFLPFGTRIQIPEVFGRKIFVVEDRMHARKINFVDIWMPTKDQAKHFGVRKAPIIVLP